MARTITRARRLPPQEPIMNVKQIVLDVVRSIFSRRRKDDFVCGDCTRNAQCGAEPSEHCVIRAAQIASDRKGPPPRERLIGW